MRENFIRVGMRLNGPQHAIKLLMMLSVQLSSSFKDKIVSLRPSSLFKPFGGRAKKQEK